MKTQANITMMKPRENTSTRAYVRAHTVYVVHSLGDPAALPPPATQAAVSYLSFPHSPHAVQVTSAVPFPATDTYLPVPQACVHARTSCHHPQRRKDADGVQSSSHKARFA